MQRERRLKQHEHQETVGITNNSGPFNLSGIWNNFCNIRKSVHR